MSYDLISRKILEERFDYYLRHTGKDQPEHYAYRVAIKEVKETPTAFDKEKVIEELRQEAMYELGISEKKFNCDEGEYSTYCSISFFQAKRIVEKGGIE